MQQNQYEPELITRMRHVTNILNLCNAIDRKVYFNELTRAKGFDYSEIVFSLYSQAWQEKNGPREL